VKETGREEGTGAGTTATVAKLTGVTQAGPLSGILVVDKPVGPTSHDVVALVRRLTDVRRVGHGGTLDPFARGVLPVFIGTATRVLEYHLGDPKSYRATVVFGARSTTDDLEGELTQTDAAPPDREAVEAALDGFRGTIRQRPPAFSAVKVAGRRAYRAARAGEPLELPERIVTVQRFEIVGWDDGDPGRPAAVLEVDCSAGTYVRSLARDLGEHLGTGAYLGTLVRTASGAFRLGDALGLDAVRSRAAAGELQAVLLPIDHGLERFPVHRLTDVEVAAVARGQIVRPAGVIPDEPAERVRLIDGAGQLVAIAQVLGGRLHPEKVFQNVPLEPA
jgi:tRNA pseudouridine55 synthase